MGLDLEEQKVRVDSAAKRPSFSFGNTPRFTTTNEKPISFKNRVKFSSKATSTPRHPAKPKLNARKGLWEKYNRSYDWSANHMSLSHPIKFFVKSVSFYDFQDGRQWSGKYSQWLAIF